MSLAVVGLAVVTAASILLLAAGPGSSLGAQGKVFVQAVPSNPGPLPPCPSGQNPCPLDSYEQIVLYTTNTYPLTTWIDNSSGPDARARWHATNAFDVSSIDYTITVDGAFSGSGTITPPPNGTFPSPGAWDGHWPSTVRCPSGPSSCYVTGTPAVLPGETTAPLYFSWLHAEGEPTGKYVFTFTLHGTVNGNPVDVTGSTPKIEMN